MSNVNEPRTSRTAKTSRPSRKPRGISHTIGGHTFPTTTAAEEFIQTLLHARPLREIVAEPDHSFLCDLLSRHPDAAEKIGTGVRHFTAEPSKGGKRCFYVTRVDDSKMDFSTGKCLRGNK